jgi:hypothetical protein
MPFPRQAWIDRLSKLSLAQNSIQGVADWVLFYKKFADEAVGMWQDAFLAAPEPKQLTLMYLCNDISHKAKRVPAFAVAFATVMPVVLDAAYVSASDKTKRSIQRLVDIWQARELYPLSFLKQLRAQLGMPTFNSTNVESNTRKRQRIDAGDSSSSSTSSSSASSSSSSSSSGHVLTDSKHSSSFDLPRFPSARGNDAFLAVVKRAKGAARSANEAASRMPDGVTLASVQSTSSPVLLKQMDTTHTAYIAALTNAQKDSNQLVGDLEVLLAAIRSDIVSFDEQMTHAVLVRTAIQNEIFSPGTVGQMEPMSQDFNPNNVSFPDYDEEGAYEP